MKGGSSVTNGGDRLRRIAPYAVAAGLLGVAVIGNLASTAHRLAKLSHPVDLVVPVMDELTSAAAWLAILPVIVAAFRRVSPSSFPWVAIISIHAAFIPVVSLVHFVLTRLLRTAIFALQGEGFSYVFAWDAFAADLYGDVLTYLLFGFICRGVERFFLYRAVVTEENGASNVPFAPLIEIRDGAQTVYLPASEILWAEAAGNYVELHASGARNFLMRGTLISLGERLANAGFLRIHRSRLVNAAAILAVESNPWGDATLLLTNGATISASRRYRAALCEALTARMEDKTRGVDGAGKDA